jgi:hypothetical protein
LARSLAGTREIAPRGFSTLLGSAVIEEVVRPSPGIGRDGRDYDLHLLLDYK